MKLKEINNGNIFCKQSKKFNDIKIEIVKPENYYSKKRNLRPRLEDKNEQQ